MKTIWAEMNSQLMRGIVHSLAKLALQRTATKLKQ
jgi:hypothetical protein